MILMACLLDLAFGWPDWLYARVGHPVTWIGAGVTWVERWNQGDHRLVKGAVATALVVGVTAGIASVIQSALPSGWMGCVIGAVLAWPLIAIRSMHAHVAAVARPLGQDLAEARRAVAMIVGRDPAQLDQPGVARAALESLAENTSDGIVAPVLWGAVFGLPGIAAYKAINTLDSMIGHRTARYEQFGKVAARLDDLANVVPARVTGALFAGLSRDAWRGMARDARRHRSPNAGWPEAAMAGALGVRLSGPRSYGDQVNDEPWLNPGARDPEPADLWRGLGLYRRTIGLMLAGLALWSTL